MDVVKHLFGHLKGGGQCILAVFLSFILVTSMVPASAIPAYADEVVAENVTGTDPPENTADDQSSSADNDQQEALENTTGGETDTPDFVMPEPEQEEDPEEAIEAHDDAPTAGDGWEWTTSTTLGITNAAGLVAFSAMVNGTFDADDDGEAEPADSFAGKTAYLTADIDMEGVDFTPIGSSDHPFAGTFDGCGHAISNLTEVLPATPSFAGLFMKVAGKEDDRAVIQNLVLENASFERPKSDTTNGGAGLLAETLTYTDVLNSSFQGSITGAFLNAGGIASVMDNTTIVGCSIDVTVYSSHMMLNGGLIGQQVTGTCVVFDTAVKGGCTSSNMIKQFGAIAYSAKGLTVTNSYMAASGLNLFGGSATVAYSNVYSTVGSATDGLTIVDASYLTTPEAVAALNGDRTGTSAPWRSDVSSDPINGGGPILKWQTDAPLEGAEADGAGGPEDVVVPECGYAWDDNGTELTIYNADGLNFFAAMVNGNFTLDGVVQSADNFTGKTVKLAADIDMQHVANFQPIGDYWNTDGYFSGHFDGYGHEITNLNVNASEDAGLFGEVYPPDDALDKTPIIENVTIEGSVSGNCGSGLLAGYIGDAVVSNCHVKGNVYDRDSYAGGLIGMTGSCMITSCSAEANVQSGSHVGGLVGYALSKTTIDGCWASGSVMGASSTGGFVGSLRNTVDDPNKKCIIKDSYSTTATEDGQATFIGAIDGKYSGSYLMISNCYTSTRGDLFGFSSSHMGTIVFDGFYALDEIGEIPGTVQGLDTVQVMSEAELKAAAATLNADRSPEVWIADEHNLNGGYPILAWQLGGGSSDEDVIEADLIIWNADDLVAFSEAVNGGDNFAGKTVALGADIDLSGVENFVPIGYASPYFAGSFDGHNHTISNLNIDVASNYAGLFGYVKGSVDEPASIANVNITSANVNSSKSMVAVLVGMLQNADMRNCNVDGSVTSAASMSYAGGIVGRAADANIVACTVDVEVSGLQYVGGAFGIAHSATYVDKIFASGTVSGFNYVGGFTGGTGASRACNVTYEECGFRGNVINTRAEYDKTGGFSGGMLVGPSGCEAAFRDCYAVASVQSERLSGSFVGYAYVNDCAVEFENCYAYDENNAPVLGSEASEGTFIINGLWSTNAAFNNSASEVQGADTLKQVSASELKALTPTLNAVHSSDVWMADDYGINGGFPLHAWRLDNNSSDGALTPTGIAFDDTSGMQISSRGDAVSVGCKITGNLTGEKNISMAPEGILDACYENGTIVLKPISHPESDVKVTVTLTIPESNGYMKGKASFDVLVYDPEVTVEVGLADPYTITRNGTYHVASGMAGTINVASDVTDVTIVGNGVAWDAVNMTTVPNANLYLDMTNAPGIKLTLRDLYLSTTAMSTDTINFAGQGNELAIEGTVLIDHDRQDDGNCAVHVGAGTELRVTGDGTFYLYKYEQGSGIGGHMGESNGPITFDMDGALYAKGSKQGAVIGSGATAASTQPITFESGTYNIIGVARGALIGAGAGSQQCSGYQVYIQDGVNMTLYTDWTGAAIGGGGNDDGNDTYGGDVYIGGANLRVFCTANSETSGTDWPNGISAAPITANKYQMNTKESVYLAAVDTAMLDFDYASFDVRLDDGDSWSAKGLTLQQYLYANEASIKDEQANVTVTPTNWVPVNDRTKDTNLYFFLTARDHTMDINGEAVTIAWDADTQTFTATRDRSAEEDGARVWEGEGWKATLWPNGALEFTGEGQLPAYGNAADVPWVTDAADRILSVQFASTLSGADLSRYFEGCANLKFVKNLPADVTALASTFKGCAALAAAPIIPDTVQNMSSAFEDCRLISELPGIPSGVTDLSFAFKGCLGIVSIPDDFAVADGVPMEGLFDAAASEEPVVTLAASYEYNALSQDDRFDWNGWNRTLQVDPDRVAVPVITSQPANVSFLEGASKDISVSAAASDGKSPLTYQWYMSDDADAAVKQAIPGATDPVYTAQGAQLGTKYYVCVVSVGEESVATQVAKATCVEGIYIRTVEDLVNFSNDVNSGNSYAGKGVVLENDLDLTGVDIDPIGVGYWGGAALSTPNTPFSGSFFGQGHTISNVRITNDSIVTDGVKRYVYYTGLFASVCGVDEENHASIEDLSVTGTFVGSDDVSATSAGCLVGYSEYADIERCSASALVDMLPPGRFSGQPKAGVLIGETHQTNVVDCYSEGEVYSSFYAGGLIGYCAESNVLRCGSSADVVGYRNPSNPEWYGGFGGLIGVVFSEGTCEQSYSTGTVRGPGSCAGLIGLAKASYIGTYDLNPAIKDCYTTAEVIQGASGAFMGYVNRSRTNKATVDNAYATAECTYFGGGGFGNNQAFGGLDLYNCFGLAPEAALYDWSGSYQPVASLLELASKVDQLNDGRTGADAPWVVVPGVNDGMPIFAWQTGDASWPSVSNDTLLIDDSIGTIPPGGLKYSIYSAGAQLPHMTRTGYVLTGWTCSVDGAIVERDGAWVIADGVSGPLEAAPVWTPVVYSITYVDAGTVIASSVNKGTYTIEDETFEFAAYEEREGFRFAGWYDNEDGDGIPVAGVEQGSVGDMVLYAKWTEDDGQGLTWNDDQGCWEITSVTALLDFRDRVNEGESFAGQTVSLCADLHLKGSGFTPIGATEDAPFAGVFQGNGHLIDGLILADPESSRVGFFGNIVGVSNEQRAQVCDLRVNALLDGLERVGAIVGNGSMLDIEQCTVDVEYASGCDGRYLGGIAGGIDNASIRACQSAGSIIGYSTLGGLVGRGERLEIQQSSSSATVFSNCHGVDILYRWHLGGLVGELRYSTVKECFAAGDVTGRESGGLIGVIYGSNLIDCYYGNAVLQTIWGGLLVGEASVSASSVINCYSMGTYEDLYGSTSVEEYLFGDVEYADVIVQNVAGRNGVTYRGTLVGEVTIVGPADIQGAAGVAMMSADRPDSPWVEDTLGVNDGYPILAWQLAAQPDEDDPEPVEPDPVVDTISVEASVTGDGAMQVAEAVEPGEDLTVTAEAADGSYLAQIRYAIVDDPDYNPYESLENALAALFGDEAVQFSADDVDGEEAEEAAPVAYTALEVVDGTATIQVPEDLAEGKAIRVVADFVPVVWDGTIDLTWYDADSTSFTLEYAAQYAGLAAIVNGIFTTFPVAEGGALDVAAYEAGMGKSEDGNALYGEFQGTYTLNDSQNGHAEATVTKTARVVGDADAIVPQCSDKDADGGNNETSSSNYWFGADDFANKTVLIGADLDFGGTQSGGAWSTDSPLFMSLGGQYTMVPNNTGSIIGSSWNGVLDGCGHSFRNVYGERYASTAYGDASTFGLVGRIGVHDNDTVVSATPAVRQIVLESGLISSRRSVGGIVGKIGKTSTPAVIEYCINKATVTGTDKKGVGGIVGASWNSGVIRYCANFGAVSCPNSEGAGFLAGGIVGSNEVPIINCYNVGSVTAGSSNNAMAIGTSNGSVTEVTNCWFLAGSAAGGGYFVKNSADAAQLNGSKSFAAGKLTAADLNADGGDIWMAGDANTFEGHAYPVLFFQNGSIDANETYQVELQQPETGTLTASPAEGAYGTAVTLSCAPAPGWAVETYVVDGSPIAGNEFVLTGNAQVSAQMRERTSAQITLSNPFADACTITVTKTGIALVDGALQEVSDWPVNDGDMLYDGDVLSVAVALKDGAQPADPTQSYNGAFTVTDGKYFYRGSAVDPVIYPVAQGVDKITLTVDKLDAGAKVWSSVADTSWYDVDDVKASYEISTAAQLAGLAQLVASGVTFEGVEVKLGSSISLADEDGSVRLWDAAIGTETAPFKGTFNGSGHEVSGLYATYAGSALFGHVNGAEVIDLTVSGQVASNGGAAGVIFSAVDSVVSGCTNAVEVSGAGAEVAGVVASATGCTVSGCVNQAPVTNNQASSTSVTGGVVGHASNTALADCRNEGDVTGKGYVGGIVGRFTGSVQGNASLEDCVNTGAVTSAIETDTNVRAGGIAGSVEVACTVSGCTNEGGVSAAGGNKAYAAGIVADATVSIVLDDCQNSGSVAAEGAAGSAYAADLACSSKGNSVTVSVKDVSVPEDTDLPMVANCKLVDLNAQPDETEPGPGEDEGDDDATDPEPGEDEDDEAEPDEGDDEEADDEEGDDEEADEQEPDEGEQEEGPADEVKPADPVAGTQKPAGSTGSAGASSGVPGYQPSAAGVRSSTGTYASSPSVSTDESDEDAAGSGVPGIIDRQKSGSEDAQIADDETPLGAEEDGLTNEFPWIPLAVLLALLGALGGGLLFAKRRRDKEGEEVENLVS